MAGIFRLLLCGAAAVSFSASAAQDEDGFVWIDANTKIKLTPTSSPAGGGATRSSAAPEKEPAKAKKPEKPKK